MYYVLRIIAKPILLLVLLFSVQVGAESQPQNMTSERGADSPSTDVAEPKAVVPSYFQSAQSPKTAQSGSDSNSTLWLLLGGAGLGLVFFWLGRRSGGDSAPLDMPRRIDPNAHAKSSVVRGDAVREAQYWTSLDQATTVTVDELSSVEEEAEVFLLLGRMDMAIGVLRHHVEANDAAPAHVWMTLLDVLHTQGLRREFEKLAQEIRGRFNVALPTWEDANARSSGLSGLEHFPHLFAKIVSLWRSPDCLDYLHGLTQDNRNGERGGFHLEAFRELLMLIGVLENRERMTEPQAFSS